MAGGAGIALGQTDPRQRRSHEQRVGHGFTVCGAAGARPRELVEHDAVVVEGDVGELWAAVDVADGEDVPLTGAQMFIDADRSAVGDANAARVQREAGGHGSAACSGEDDVGLHGPRRPW